MTPRRHKLGNRKYVLGPKLMFAKRDKQDPSRSGQTSLATAVANFTKPRTSHFFDLCMWEGIKFFAIELSFCPLKHVWTKYRDSL